MQAIVGDGRKGDAAVSYWKHFWNIFCNHQTEKNLEFLSVGIRAGEDTAECWGKRRILPIQNVVPLIHIVLVFDYLQQQNELMYGEEGTCTLCSKTFARKSSLLTHIRNHTAERKYSCPTCQKSELNFLTRCCRRSTDRCQIKNVVCCYSIYASSQSQESWENSYPSSTICLCGLWQR